MMQILQVACQTLGCHCWEFRPDEFSYPFYQNIQRISLNILRYTLYILQSQQVACENCCSYCAKSWTDLSSYHFYQDIGCISRRFCESHYSTLFQSSCHDPVAIDIKTFQNDVYSSILCHSVFGSSSQVLLCAVQRIEQFALEDRLPRHSPFWIDHSRQGMLDDFVHPTGSIDMWPL
jgi:hypothetical protein